MADRTRELLTELVKLRSSWESRTVEVRTGDLTTTLFLNFGEIAAVKASKPGEPIGRILLRKGLISREHYVEVLERLGEVLNTGERVAFGEVAVGLGYVAARDVSASLAAQVRALAMRVFQDADPEWTISPLPENRDPSRDLTMRVEAVFLDAVRLLDEARRGALGFDAARPLALRPVWSLSEIDVRLELTADEAEFVRVAFAGDKTVEELLHASSASSPAPVDVTAVITALIACGAAESRSRVAAEHHSKPESRKEPPPLPAWVTVDATKAKDAAATAVRARGGSLAPKEGASPLELMLRAEQIFERGREAFSKGDMNSALGEFEQALALNPASVECQLFAHWSRHRLSGAELNAAVLSDLERRARGALRENPHFAIAHLVLSVVHEASGRPEEARAELARVRELDRELLASVDVPRAAEPAKLEPSSKAVPTASAVAGPKSPAAVAKGQPAEGGARPAPSKGPPWAILAVLGGLGVAGVVAFSALRSRSAEPTEAASAVPNVAAPVDAGAVNAGVVDAGAVSAIPRAAPAAGSRPDAGVPPGASAAPIDPSRGIVHLPKSAQGHRVFVDGRPDTTDSDHLVLRCGHHEIRIGSQGTARPVDVPCGGEVDLR